jgi:hypothetical protein
VESINFSRLLELSKSNEGIVLMGCGGNLDEWINGVTKELMDRCLVKSDFKEIFVSVSTGGRCDITMLFNDEQEVDIGKMAIWRLQFGSRSWLSDFVVNYRKQYEIVDSINVKQKPKCKLVGSDGNIFNLIGIARDALRRAGLRDEAKKLCEEAMMCSNYDEAIRKILEYVEEEGEVEDEERVEEDMDGSDEDICEDRDEEDLEKE